MTIDDDHHGCSCGEPDPAGQLARPHVMTRRRLFSAAAVGIGAFGLSRMGASAGSFDELVVPGRALEPAERIPAPTTTLPPRTGPFPFEPPAPGEILFPIVVGETDHCYVLDNFGDRRGRTDGYFHQACDIMADEGLPLRAVVDGVLTKWYTGRFNGWRLYDDQNDVLYKYFHNQPDPNGWVEGDRVAQGDIIGFVGDTGTSAGNFHLHFEYRPGDVPMDPFHKLQRQQHVHFSGEG